MDRPRIRLTRLKIDKFRSAAPTELFFAPGHNVLVGRNGTGKTNLLKLISAVVSGNLGWIVSDGDDAEFSWDFAFDGWTCTAHFVKAIAPVVSDVHTDAPEAESRLTVRLRYGALLHASVTLTEHEGLVQIGGNDPTKFPAPARRWDHSHQAAAGRLIAALAKGGDAEALRQATLLLNALHRCSGVLRVDEGLDAFRWMVGERSPELGPARSTFQVDWVAGGGVATSTASDALDAAVEAALAAHLAGVIELKSEMPFTQQFQELTAAADVTTRAFSPDYDEDSARFDKLAFEMVLPSGRRLHHDRWSYGQRRLLAFLFQLDRCPDFLIADELANGFHHSWIERAFELMEGRQTFLTSQNPLLLNHLEFPDEEAVKRSLVLCRAGPPETPWVWTQPDDDDAGDFKRAYDVGIQHVSDLLRDQGLW